MDSKHAGVGGLLIAVLVGGVLMMPVSSGAQAGSPADAAVGSESSGRSVLTGVGAVLASAVYAPFKAVIMCPAGAVAAGVTYAAARGEGETPNYLLRLGCTGTYVVSPAMIQGREAFRAYDER